GDGTTSIQGETPDQPLSTNGSLYVYPNPVKSTFTVLIPRPLINPRLKIFNLHGQEVYAEDSIQAQSDQLRVKLPADLEGGFYLLQLDDGLRRYSTRLMVGE
ncbi:MAG: T9SS type A sorting domain-containing protein, partial [Bacteroidota bacterium]